jgi:hypothetical protein
LTSSPVYAQALTREKQKHCLCISRIQIIRWSFYQVYFKT